jgi:predicted nucleic acid-binding protein
LFISVVNVVEVRFGIEIAEPSRKYDLDRWLARTVRPMFGGRVLPISEEVLLRWRLLVHEGRKVGRTFPQPDLILAATALEHDLTLVTRNVRDFSAIPMRIFNPWDQQP